MGQLSSSLGRDVGHIKDDLRLTAERLWGMDPAAFEGIDPLVDLLLTAFAQEIFAVQQDVHRHKLRMVETAAQAMLPVELSAPRPAHVVLHGRPLDPGTYTHRVKTVLSATQAMDVHDRVGRSFTFTPADEFRLHNGAVKYMVHGNKLHTIDARSGGKRTVVTGEGHPLEPDTLWIGLEMKEPIDPAMGLPFFFSLPTNDADEWQLPLHLPALRFDVAGQPCGTVSGLRSRTERTPSFDRVMDPVAACEHEAIAYYQNRFVTLYPPTAEPQGLSRSAPPPSEFRGVFNGDAIDELGNDLVWLRVQLPAAIGRSMINRLQCSINCFPAIDRKRHERSASHTALVPLDSGPADQFWAVEEVVGSDRLPIPRERSVLPSLATGLVYSIRRGGIERLDEREAYERLTDLLQTVHGDHAAFAALDEHELAEGLTRVRDWLQEYRTRHKAPPFPAVYLLLNEAPAGNVHVDYWTTSGSAAGRIPAFKPFRLESGSFLTEARSMTVPVGGEDTSTSGSVSDRLRSVLSSSNQVMPTLFAVRAQCMELLPVQLRDQVRLEIRREVMMGTKEDSGLIRALRITLRASDDVGQDAGSWHGICAQIQNVVGRRLSGLLPVVVDFKRME